MLHTMVKREIPQSESCTQPRGVTAGSPGEILGVVQCKRQERACVLAAAASLFHAYQASPLCRKHPQERCND